MPHGASMGHGQAATMQDGMEAKGWFPAAKAHYTHATPMFSADVRFSVAPKAGPVDIVVLLQSPDGSPLENAQVGLNLYMPAMRMGDDHRVLALRERAPGHFEGHLEFSMGGDWLVNLIVTTPQGTGLGVLTLNVPWE